jgi:Uma2 family endonuclease
MMTNAQPLVTMTPQEYLAWERQQETRHEYVNGEIHAMTGASRRHNLVCGNLFASLHNQMRGKPCEVYSNDMRVKVKETGMYTYPDIAVACGEPRFEDAQIDTLLDPVLIVEVLSESTEGYDRGAKFLHYRNLASLRDYLLVAQAEYRVEHYARQDGNRWLLTEFQALDDSITLTSIDCILSLRDLYERVELPQAGIGQTDV